MVDAVHIGCLTKDVVVCTGYVVDRVVSVHIAAVGGVVFVHGFGNCVGWTQVEVAAVVERLPDDKSTVVERQSL